MRRERRKSNSSPAKSNKTLQIRLRFIALAAMIGTAIVVLALIKPNKTPPPDPPSLPNLKLLLDQAESLIGRGEFDQADEILGKVLGRDASNSMAWLYRGQLKQQQGDLDGVLEACQHVGDVPAKLGGTARYVEAMAYLRSNMARRAEQHFLRSVELNPRYLQPHQRLLELYVLQMRRPEIRRLLHRIEYLRGLSLDELLLRRSAGEQVIETEQAMGLLKSFIKADRDDARSPISLARYLNADSRHEEAVELLAELLLSHPENQQVRGVLIESYLELDQIEAAASLLKEHSPQALSPLSLWRGAGELARILGDLRQAAEHFERVVEIDPDDQPTQYQLGLLFQQLGQEQDARTHLDKASLLDQLRQQIKLVPQAKRKQKGMLISLSVEIGDLLFRLKQHAESASWYHHALSLNPAEIAALTGLERAQRAAQLVVENANNRKGSTDTTAKTTNRSKQKTNRLTSNHSRLQTQSNPAHRGPVKLRDDHLRVGLDFEYFNGQTGFKRLIESIGGGVAVLDYDADGWPDLYFPQGTPLPVDLKQSSHTDRLFRNESAQRFSDNTHLAGLSNPGYGQGCVAGDFDNDGFVDLIVANFGRNVAFHNNGDGTFTDVTDAMGFVHERMSSSLALVDLDRDGDLDLYVVNYCVDSQKTCRNEQGDFITCSPESFAAEQDELYLNRGNGVFEEVTAAVGIIASDGKGLGIVTADFNGDGWPDIYVANDTTPNFLFQNQSQKESSAGKLRLVEKGLTSGAAMSSDGRAEAGMGIACADLNGDSYLDLFVTNYINESNTAYFNQEDTFFMDVSRKQGLAKPSLPFIGFGTQAVDLDLDGWLDLFVANGHIDDYGDKDQAWKMPPQLFQNQGVGVFEEVSNNAGKYFAGNYLGRGVARLDWNRDGRPDLVVVHQDSPVALLTNATVEAGNAVVLELHGVASNRNAIGAKIRITAGDFTQVREICGGDGFQASNERRQFVGLGQADQVDVLEIDWPSGQSDRWRKLPAACRLVLIEGSQPIIRTIKPSE